MEHDCKKEDIIDKFRQDISNINQEIAVLKSNYNQSREDIKSMKEDLKSISTEMMKISKTIEDRFTLQDKDKIQELKNSRTVVFGIILSILTGIAVPTILFFAGGR